MGRILTAVAVFCLFLLVASSVPAHEIKALASNQAVAQAGGKTTIYLSWGHRLPVDDLVDASTLGRYDLLSPGGKTITLKAADRSLQTNVVELPETGLYQVAVVRKPSVYTYVLDEEGNRHLRRGPKSAQNGAKIDVATRSLQCAKALISVGKLSAQAPAAAGLPIEIVPLDGPAKWTSSATLRFRVLLDGKPLPSSQVVARYVGFKPDNGWCYATFSNEKGEFTVKPCQAGTWVLKVSSKRLVQGKAREEYDLESFTATLSLEVAP
jgi:uncharacterized GH25 family protein